MVQPTCTLDGCEKPSRNKNGGAMCKMHYHRWYRHGSPTKVDDGSVSVSLGRRYRQVSRAGHPVADASGRVYVHRMVLFDEIGPGPHACHWCETQVDWLPKGSDGELQVDHLNNDGGDNRIDNLVASCRDCNTARGAQRKAAALREAGWWSSNDTIATLRTPGRRALVEPAA